MFKFAFLMANIATSGSLTEGLYKELWHACAGPMACVPREGEHVYYFPQGHIEQLEAFGHHGLAQQLSAFCLPAKIVCKVMNVQLLVEPDTDEVYANITLLPDHDQSEVTIADPTFPKPPACTVHTFCKTLAESDTKTQGGFCFLHRQAPLDISQHPPCKKLVASDLNGNEWHFRYMFQGKMGSHVLTAGWSAFVRAKKCVTGDGFVLLRGENGEMFVGVRRRMSVLNGLLPTSVTLSHDQLVVLSVASQAVTTGTRFSVTYKPRCCRSSFIISVNKYLEAQNRRICVGMRFKMSFEDEGFAVRRFAGTVVGVADSEWKSIQVRWNETSSKMALPDKVSSWELECRRTSMWSSGLKEFKSLCCWSCL